VIEVEDGILTVSGGRQRTGRTWAVAATRAASVASAAFSRSIALPSGVDAQAIKAQTRDAWSR
jgi:HSP20 family molecular chaperone IbpA